MVAVQTPGHSATEGVERAADWNDHKPRNRKHFRRSGTRILVLQPALERRRGLRCARPYSAVFAVFLSLVTTRGSDASARHPLHAKHNRGPKTHTHRQ